MKLTPLRISVVAQILLAIYFQANQWIPLGNWNFQPGSEALLTSAFQGRLDVQNVLLAALFIIPAILFVLALLRKVMWLMWLCLVGYTVWLLLQIQTWWVGYLFGASDQWAEVYHRVFSQSTQILPSFGRHLAPDGMHLVLQLLLATIVVSTTVALIQRRRRPQDETPPSKK